PDGVVHDVTPIGGIPCLGRTDGVICTPGVNSINSQTVTYTVRAQDLPGGSCSAGATIAAATDYSGGTAHISASDSPPTVSGHTPFSLPLTCCPRDTNVCNGTEGCNPATVFTDPINGDPRQGQCFAGTPLNCDDTNACTADTCDPTNGCVHTPVNCNDSNACTTDTCDATNGCVHTAVSCDDTNACTTDTCDATNGCVHTADNCHDTNVST